MKKIILVFVMFILLTGCNSLMNSPTKKVEYLLGKYQKGDDEVLQQLSDTLLTDAILSVSQKERYKNIMIRQYHDLMYTIKDEAIDGKNAVVEVEIEVYDYSKAITDTENTLLTNADSFKDETGEVNTTIYNDKKLEALENMNDRVKYTINFTLSKVEDEWIVDDLTETERTKIHGLYAY